ncbi:MAG TPA: tryptophan--tRNA ligase [Candidatus Pacearchaeota archaeon]|nr:tryptophan--tRNA ligase [Candidatus Pacearchaeota archaeon]
MKINNTMSKRVLTGDRPSGPLHLGHYFGSLQNRIEMQNTHDCYFIIADYEYLTDHINATENFEKNIESLVLDYLAVGIDPEKSAIFVESQIPQIAELNLIFSMMVKMSRVQRNPTIKDEIASRGIDNASFGFIGWPIIQAADILSMKAHFVPVGEDQLPHIEQTREIARYFNSNFSEIFPIPEPIIPKGAISRLPGLDGKKMSKSLNNAIFLSDDVATVEKKIMSAITDPQKIKADDPGRPEICTIFKYYEIFAPEIASKRQKECQAGKIGCVACKKEIAAYINKFLDPIRQRRNELSKDKSLVRKVLQSGHKKASALAQQTLAEVKNAMKINYKDII